jgi:hypothetical protein
MANQTLFMMPKQQGSVLLMGLILLMLGLQLFLTVVNIFVDLQSSLNKWIFLQTTEKVLLNRARNWHQFDFQWQDLGQYPCIVICQPDCKATHHGLVTLSLNDWRIILRVVLPIDGLNCEKKNSIQIPNNILYFRFNRIASSW